MKLEKREVTLNEFDSLQDAFYFERALLSQYVCCLQQAQRKETRAQLLKLITEIGEDIFFLCDLLGGSAIENRSSDE
ncbi:MAG: hypothetical protein IJX87_04385 [Clostridia bacterium]|nr:hypothetical protein [Clostridia bacterium]